MRAYKVFLIVRVGRNASHTGLFFETAIDHRGTIVHVSGNGRDGMRLHRYTESALDSTWDDNRKDHIGWVMEVKLEKVWNVVRTIPPPGKPGARSRTPREWTDLVMRALQRQGVMENTRENEATVHEETPHRIAEEELSPLPTRPPLSPWQSDNEISEEE
ncbi:hypothetical protein LEL_04756 [Akanthomyces lecanii RCEF 1005]|uniref:Uncharacterized protein n=1 Tax=Akanthomyces lecanii RCEF 1005 TaxID=1081108 RepID=A0A162K769_CORDF|nr:hypothetical protein LEL_04756 [Akanthomyces lecanii RCEF 1005]